MSFMVLAFFSLVIFGQPDNGDYPLWGSLFSQSVSASKISSMRCLKSRAIFNARGKLGSYFSVSMALIVCRETPSLSARSDCDHSLAALNSRRQFFIGNAD